MISKLKLFFWYPHANFQLWSQSLFFTKTFSAFSKNGQKKCPKMKIRKYFWKRKSLKYDKSPKLLKDRTSYYSHFKIHYINNLKMWYDIR
jgi:hypothetical protein